MLSGLPRPTLLERIITNRYAPPRGSEPPRVEVAAPGADQVKYIMRRWEPFDYCPNSVVLRLVYCKF